MVNYYYNNTKGHFIRQYLCFLLCRIQLFFQVFGTDRGEKALKRGNNLVQQLE